MGPTPHATKGGEVLPLDRALSRAACRIEGRVTNLNPPDPDFLEAIDSISKEIDSNRTFWERVKDKAKTLRLLIVLILCKWRRKGRDD